MRRILLFGVSLCVACSATANEESTASQSLPIIGGVADSDAQAHDSVVFLMIGNGGGCTGSLIAPNLVLTARHCVSNVIVQGIDCDPYGGSSQAAHVGNNLTASNISVFTGWAPSMCPKAAPAHGKQIFANDANKLLCNNDIALILLDQAVAGAEPMKLRVNYSAQIGEKVMAIGYGLTNQNNQNSAGRRFRRANIPVVTAGMDLNYYTSAMEFVLGQSTCQGDSGGPVVAMDTGAILGITSRGGDCNTGFQTFTMVNKHMDLINKALAAAGATAVEEGNAVPTPTPPKANGQGPCAVGAECKGYYCMQGKYCTGFCNPSMCPIDMVCLSTTIDIMGSPTTQPVPICQPIPTGDACVTCRVNECQSWYEWCDQNADCWKILQCVDSCGTVECRDACPAKYPKGQEDYEVLRKCTCESSCGSSCNAQCGVPTPVVPDAGAGGSAGAGGEGGSGGDGVAGDPGAAGDGNPAVDQPVDSGSGGGCSTSRSSGVAGFGMISLLAAMIASRRRAR